MKLRDKIIDIFKKPEIWKLTQEINKLKEEKRKLLEEELRGLLRGKVILGLKGSSIKVIGDVQVIIIQGEKYSICLKNCKSISEIYLGLSTKQFNYAENNEVIIDLKDIFSSDNTDYDFAEIKESEYWSSLVNDILRDIR